MAANTGAGKRGTWGVVVALVVLLAGAAWAYGTLSGRQDPVAATGAEQDAGEATDASDGDAAAGREGASEDLDPNAIYLSDYDATVYTDLGEPMLLTAIADGRPLVMNFWATWCPYCVQEMPDFLQVYREYADSVSFAFVDAADGRRERMEDAVAWLGDNGFSELPAYYDTAMDAVQTFGVYSFPTTVVVSADGQILAVSPGAIDADRLRSALDELV